MSPEAEGANDDEKNFRSGTQKNTIGYEKKD